MKESKRNKFKKLEKIREKIENKDTSVDSGIKLLKETAKIRKELDDSLFKKKGGVYIVKESIAGEFQLHKFEDEE